MLIQISYVQLVGLEKLAGQIMDDQLVLTFKEVLQNEKIIKEIIQWLNAYIAADQKKKAEEQAKPKHTDTDQAAKKVKVPEIYATAKETTKTSESDQKKGRQHERTQDRPRKESDKDNR
jgi:hypothetical protein